MTDATLSMFRTIAGEMGIGGNWQWVGRWDSQRMFGISRERAEEYARLYGGKAEPMPAK